jgi:hypothetical protein
LSSKQMLMNSKSLFHGKIFTFISGNKEEAYNYF